MFSETEVSEQPQQLVLRAFQGKILEPFPVSQHDRHMDYEQVVATWICFMATAFRKFRGLTRTQFIELSKKYRIIPFLASNYELLHYYDNEYVVNDIVRYIAEQGGSLDELS